MVTKTRFEEDPKITIQSFEEDPKITIQRLRNFIKLQYDTIDELEMSNKYQTKALKLFINSFQEGYSDGGKVFSAKQCLEMSEALQVLVNKRS